jgi:hypothetical protein
MDTSNDVSSLSRSRSRPSQSGMYSDHAILRYQLENKPIKFFINSYKNKEIRKIDSKIKNENN